LSLDETKQICFYQDKKIVTNLSLTHNQVQEIIGKNMKQYELKWLIEYKVETSNVFESQLRRFDTGGSVNDDFSDGEKFLSIPEQVEDAIEPIFKQYDQLPFWVLSGIEKSCPDSPWAFVCVDKEYSIAGHFTTSNPKNSGILFSPYLKHPDPIPPNFVPKVGIVIIQMKSGLETAKNNSLLFQQLWDYLEDCDHTRPWLIAADPLPIEWLNQIVPGDSELWLSNR
jgi:hypothetical protein